MMKVFVFALALVLSVGAMASPKAVRKIPPEFPPEAVRKNINSGEVKAKLTIAADGSRDYDFGPVIWFWLASSFVSMLLAATLWRVRLRD